MMTSVQFSVVLEKKLVRLETFIQNAFVNKEHAVFVFFDFEEAYDTTWIYSILKYLLYIGIKIF